MNKTHAEKVRIQQVQEALGKGYNRAATVWQKAKDQPGAFATEPFKNSFDCLLTYEGVSGTLAKHRLPSGVTITCESLYQLTSFLEVVTLASSEPFKREENLSFELMKEKAVWTLLDTRRRLRASGNTLNLKVVGLSVEDELSIPKELLVNLARQAHVWLFFYSLVSQGTDTLLNAPSIVLKDGTFFVNTDNLFIETPYWYQGKTMPVTLPWDKSLSSEVNSFPLGVDTNGEKVLWNTLFNRSLLVTGGTGAGLSVLLRVLLLSLEAHKRRWTYKLFTEESHSDYHFVTNKEAIVSAETHNPAAIIEELKKLKASLEVFRDSPRDSIKQNTMLLLCFSNPQEFFGELHEEFRELLTFFVKQGPGYKTFAGLFTGGYANENSYLTNLFAAIILLGYRALIADATLKKTHEALSSHFNAYGYGTYKLPFEEQKAFRMYYAPLDLGR